MSEVEAAPKDLAAERVLSIDALRGFDMFWITGGKGVIVTMIALIFGGVPAWLDFHFEHVEWEGFAAWDLIMPLFLFIVGASMPFSFAKRKPGKDTYMKIARRFVLLFILGMIAQGHLIGAVTSFDFGQLHFYSNTLQAIACGYVVASLALLHLPVIGQVILCGVLLLGYWAAITFIPIPGHAAGILQEHANLAMLVDETLLGRFRDGTTYTWIFSSLGFAASVLFGVMAGHILKSEISQKQKLGALVGIGLGCLIVGGVWGMYFPVIKHIWTSSMVLWAAGWSYLLLAFFYLMLDMLGYRRWAWGFVIIGSNAIVAYMVGEKLVEILDDPLMGALSGLGSIGEFLAAFIAFGVMWTGLYIMYRKRIFVRI